MDKEKYYKYMLLLAAIYNIVNSTIFIIVTIVATDMFAMFGVPIPPSMLWLQLSLILIFILGLGYIIVSRDLSQNHGLIVIGGLSKVMFFILTVIYLFLGGVNILIVSLGGIDILFVCLFIEFLKNYE